MRGELLGAGQKDRSCRSTPLYPLVMGRPHLTARMRVSRTHLSQGSRVLGPFI